MLNKSNDSIELRESILWLMNLMIIVFSFIDNRILYINFFWTLNILILGNVKNIGRDTDNLILIFLRRCCFFLHFLPILFLDIYHESMLESSFFLLLLSIMVGIIFILPRYNEYILMLSTEIILFSEKITIFDHLSYGLLALMNPITEELFFRMMVISLFKEKFNCLGIAIGAILFVLHHSTVKFNEQFGIRDYIIQFIFSVVVGVVFFKTNSLVFCIVAHLTYNAPSTIRRIKEFAIFYCIE